MPKHVWLNALAALSLAAQAWPVGVAGAVTPPPTPSARPSPAPASALLDNNITYAGLGHDSHDALYRVPFGAVNPGTPITLRFRTYHNDVTSVRVRVWDTALNGEAFRSLTPAATDVSCYDPALVLTCDFWTATLTPTTLGTLYYRFIVEDGTATAYYADDQHMNGGWGTATADMVDNSYAITVFDPAFEVIPWMQDAVIYQIFPDRFRNGSPQNDLATGTPRYDDPVLRLTNWAELPEGYCRKYAGANPTTCPWRFGPVPTWGVALPETPRGRDYYGGDLKGVMDKLDYLQALGVNTIYFNPIFASGSNHGYDTRDYLSIDPAFGTEQDWDNLVTATTARGMRIILDGVFNHVSSDSLYFDRYEHYTATVGACEAFTSTYRLWFYFHDLPANDMTGPCAGTYPTTTATYDAWFGFDSIPVLNKNNQQVRNWIYSGTTSVAQHWLNNGAAGWRLDVMGDGSFPAEYWREFRTSVKSVKADAPIIGELWKKGEMLPKVQGDQADTGQTYRFRNAVLAYLGTVDDKGFSDDGQSLLPPSFFAEKLTSTREDYPDAAYYTLMNLLTSHDTQRVMWLLTPGARTRAEREFNAANVAVGLQRMRLAALIQMTVPGAPTIYYGEEIALTGDDDPDDRRTFPWNDQGGRWYLPVVLRNSGGTTPTVSLAPAAPAGLPNYYGALGNHALLEDYRELTALRASEPVLREGALQFLLTDDTMGTLAYQMRTVTDTAVVVINRYSTTLTITVPYGPDQLPNGLNLADALGSGVTAVTTNGAFTVTLPAMGGVVLLPTGTPDLTAPVAPTNLAAVSSNAQVALSWNPVGDAASYALFRSPVMGGGYVLLAEGLTNTVYTDTTVVNGRPYYYVVTARDAAHNEGAFSNEAVGLPSFPIAAANIETPAAITHTLSITPTEWIYGRVFVPGVTNMGGSPNSILAQFGYGPTGSTPVTWTTWVPGSYTGTFSQTFEYQGRFRPEMTGTFEYQARYSTNGGFSWTYAGLTGINTSGGTLLVQPNADTTPPSAPTLSVINNAAAFLTLQWTPVGDAAEYWLYRTTDNLTPTTPYQQFTSTTTVYTDTGVTTGTRYTYTVRAVDAALNASAHSNAVSAVPTPRNVNVVFNVAVPATTPVTRTVYIVGGQPQICNWCNPHTVPLTQTAPNTWSVTLVFSEATNIPYKFTLGSWDYVEKNAGCGEIDNRVLVVSSVAATQTVAHTVVNWRNVAPCGN